MADINAIADQIQGLTLLEASQLVKMLEEKLGVSAAAATVVAGGGGGGGGGGSPSLGEREVFFFAPGGGGEKVHIIKVGLEGLTTVVQGSKRVVGGGPHRLKEK